MKNKTCNLPGTVSGKGDADLAGPRPLVTQSVTAGVCRYLIDSGFAPMTEFKLANGRRADIAAVGRGGEIIMVEVKSCEADFVVDQKWTDYLGFCDQFYFAVDTRFPCAILPDNFGLIIADDYGASIVRRAAENRLAAPRRKAVTIRLARQALLRRSARAVHHVPADHSSMAVL